MSTTINYIITFISGPTLNAVHAKNAFYFLNTFQENNFFAASTNVWTIFLEYIKNITLKQFDALRESKDE